MRNFNKEYSLVRFLHAVSGAEEVDIYLNGNTFFNDLEFTKFTPYVYIPKGTYIIEVYAKDTKSNPLLKETIQVNAQELLTIAVAPSSKNGKLMLVLINEDMELASWNQSKVRFIHLVPNGRDVNLLIDNKIAFLDVKYTDVTPYLSLCPNEYRIDAESVDSKKIIYSTQVNVNSNRIYSFYVIGEAPNFEILQSLDVATFMN